MSNHHKIHVNATNTGGGCMTLVWDEAEFYEIVRTVELWPATGVYRIEIIRSMTYAELRGQSGARAAAPRYNARYYRQELAHVQHEEPGEQPRRIWVTFASPGAVYADTPEDALSGAVGFLAAEIRRVQGLEHSDDE